MGLHSATQRLDEARLAKSMIDKMLSVVIAVTGMGNGPETTGKRERGESGPRRPADGVGPPQAVPDLPFSRSPFSASEGEVVVLAVQRLGEIVEGLLAVLPLLAGWGPRSRGRLGRREPALG